MKYLTRQEELILLAVFHLRENAYLVTVRRLLKDQTGHPWSVGATGLYQIVEAVQQLRGEAGENQVANARLGMTQNIGGSGATIVTHIFERVNQ